MTEVQKSAGRPTEYREEYCDLIIEHMASGLSMESFAGTLRVSRDSLYEWRKKHPRFSDSIKIGQDLSLLFWEKLGLAGSTGRIKGFNPATYIFTMKNKHRWRDQVEITGPEDAKPIQLAYERKKSKK